MDEENSVACGPDQAGRPAHLAILEAEGIRILREVAAQAARPVLLYSRFASCVQPRLKGLTTMTNSRFNGWRMEDVWLDK